MKWFVIFYFFMVFSYGFSQIQKKPHIIFIIADDMGFNDVSFHGSNEIPTPNIDALAYNGVILNNHYTQALCTPSRASLLTGKYPIHIGMQHIVIRDGEPWGLPLNETLLPEHLKRNGYVTRAIGKWNLGFFKKEYTPTYRGFDSHYGYWQGFHDYYDHMAHATHGPEYGYDFRSNMTVDWDAKGQYSTTLFTKEAVNIIQNHDTQNPLFLYLAHLAPHAGNDWNPLQAPDEEIAKFAYINDPERRVYAAMVSMLDQSVGSVITALREKHMLENSIVVFISDNGAPTDGMHHNRGSNYPFRGMKNSVWEGALRTAAAIWSPLIKKPKRIENNLMHISDWLPTLLSAAGLNSSELPCTLDGKDQWNVISESAPSLRNEILHNIDDIYHYAVIRRGDWKFLYGSASEGKKDDWYGSTGKDPLYFYDEDCIVNSPTGIAISALTTYQQIKEKMNHLPQDNSNNYSVSILHVEDIKSLRSQATVSCKKLKPEEQRDNNQCNSKISACLFNIKQDPCEMVNLASQRPDIVIALKHALTNYKSTARKPLNVPKDPHSNPANHNGTWTNWQDADSDGLNSFSTLSHSAIAMISGGCIILFFVLLIVATLICTKYFRLSKSGLYETSEKNKEIDC